MNEGKKEHGFVTTVLGRTPIPERTKVHIAKVVRNRKETSFPLLEAILEQIKAMDDKQLTYQQVEELFDRTEGLDVCLQGKMDKFF
jgi:hypothetical protein